MSKDLEAKLVQLGATQKSLGPKLHELGKDLFVKIKTEFGSLWDLLYRRINPVRTALCHDVKGVRARSFEDCDTNEVQFMEWVRVALDGLDQLLISEAE